MVALSVLGWLAFNAVSARNHLLDARAALEAAQAASDRDDEPEVDEAARRAGAELKAASNAVSQPQWSLYAHLPWVGDDAQAVRTIAQVGATVGGTILDDLLDARGTLADGGLRRDDGSVDLARVAALRRPLGAAAAPLADAAERLGALPQNGLSSSIRDAVEAATDAAERAANAVRVADRTLNIAVPMLRGSHDYAVVFQNSAELRPTGGLPGAWSVLEVRDGRIAIGRQGSGRDVIADGPVAPIDPGIERTLGARVATDFRDTALVPDFPTAASYQQALLAAVEGVDVDGVLAIDPVAISYLLGATGPITLSSGTSLSEDNAVDYLLHQVYVDIPDPDEQDAVFAGIVKQVFDRLLSADLPTADLIDAVSRAVGERRFLVWSDEDAVQRRISRTSVSGALPADGQGVGIYFSDGTRSKMSYFLDVDATARAVDCGSEGQEYRIALTLRSTAPPDAATTEPSYVLGPDFREQGAQVVNILMLAPRGGTVPVASILGGRFPTDDLSVDGRPGALLTLLLRPGEAAPLQISMSGPAGERGPTPFGMTPTVRFASTEHTIPSACG